MRLLPLIVVLGLMSPATASARQPESGEQAGPPPQGPPPGQKGPPPEQKGQPPSPPPGAPPGAPPIVGPPGFPGGQPPPPWLIPRYRLLRDEEDWTYLVDPKMRGHDWADPMKYIPLGEREDWYLTLGGDARWWYESYQNENWGVLPFLPADADQVETDHNNYLMQRYMFHGDFHLGRRVRAFAQLKSGIVNGRIGGPRPVIDNDELDVNQAFLDVNLLLNRERAPAVTLRLGRQEMHFGTGRLVSVREGPNVRAGFDGARVIVATQRWRFDTFFVRPVITLGRGDQYPPFPRDPDAEEARGYFDDRPDYEQKFWGTFATGSVAALPFNIDLNYFGLTRRTGVFGQGLGPEERHMIGGRIWRGGIPFVPGRGWDYDVEYVYQFGKFGPGPRLGATFPFVQFQKADIRAWTLASQTGYTFNNLPLEPRIGVTAGITTGDEDPREPELQTFFTPFPNGRFFGAAQQLGPLNIQGFRPNFTVQLPRRASLTADVYFFWRQSLNDGMYNIPGFLIRPGDLTRSRYIGTQPGAEVFWPVTKHLTASVAFAYFITGEFLRDNPPDENLRYLGVILGYRF